MCASSCLAADCGFRDRCHAQAYSARVLAASRRRAARDGRPAWPATGSRPLRRTLTRVPQKVRLCAAGAACASRLMARGSRPDVHPTPTLDWHPRRGCEGTACVLTRMALTLVSTSVTRHVFGGGSSPNTALAAVPELGPGRLCALVWKTAPSPSTGYDTQAQRGQQQRVDPGWASPRYKNPAG